MLGFSKNYLHLRLTGQMIIRAAGTDFPGNCKIPSFVDVRSRVVRLKLQVAQNAILFFPLKIVTYKLGIARKNRRIMR